MFGGSQKRKRIKARPLANLRLTTVTSEIGPFPSFRIVAGFRSVRARTLFRGDDHTDDDPKGKTIFQANQWQPWLILAKMNPPYVSQEGRSNAQ
jgi:hypothetical protein